MEYIFPSEEWVATYKQAINDYAEYARAGAEWDKGPVALVCEAQPSIGIDEDVGIWLDLHHGKCRDARVVTVEEARTAPYCIIGKYARWKQVVKGRLDPIKGMMQGKFKLYGALPDIVRYVEASRALVECCSHVPTEFVDE